jgi:hypothetical protein
MLSQGTLLRFFDYSVQRSKLRGLVEATVTPFGSHSRI